MTVPLGWTWRVKSVTAPGTHFPRGRAVERETVGGDAKRGREGTGRHLGQLEAPVVPDVQADRTTDRDQADEAGGGQARGVEGLAPDHAQSAQANRYVDRAAARHEGLGLPRVDAAHHVRLDLGLARGHAVEGEPTLGLGDGRELSAAHPTHGEANHRDRPRGHAVRGQHLSRHLARAAKRHVEREGRTLGLEVSRGRALEETAGEAGRRHDAPGGNAAHHVAAGSVGEGGRLIGARDHADVGRGLGKAIARDHAFDRAQGLGLHVEIQHLAFGVDLADRHAGATRERVFGVEAHLAGRDVVEGEAAHVT